MSAVYDAIIAMNWNSPRTDRIIEVDEFLNEVGYLDHSEKFIAYRNKHDDMTIESVVLFLEDMLLLSLEDILADHHIRLSENKDMYRAYRICSFLYKLGEWDESEIICSIIDGEGDPVDIMMDLMELIESEIDPWDYIEVIESIHPIILERIYLINSERIDVEEQSTIDKERYLLARTISDKQGSNFSKSLLALPTLIPSVPYETLLKLFADSDASDIEINLIILYIVSSDDLSSMHQRVVEAYDDIVGDSSDTDKLLKTLIAVANDIKGSQL